MCHQSRWKGDRKHRLYTASSNSFSMARNKWSSGSFKETVVVAESSSAAVAALTDLPQFEIRHIQSKKKKQAHHLATPEFSMAWQKVTTHVGKIFLQKNRPPQEWWSGSTSGTTIQQCADGSHFLTVQNMLPLPPLNESPQAHHTTVCASSLLNLSISPSSDSFITGSGTRARVVSTVVATEAEKERKKEGRLFARDATAAAAVRSARSRRDSAHLTAPFALRPWYLG